MKRNGIIIALVLLAVAAAILAGPAATWLHGNDLAPPAGFTPDVVYLVAGERDQDRRSDALAALVETLPGVPPLILAGCNKAWGRFSPEAGRNLTVCEWAIKGLRARLGDASRFHMKIITGNFRGTDSEMATLGKFLSEHIELTNVVLVTSPFHVRRTYGRFKDHAPRTVAVHCVAAEPRRIDRSPWTAFAEYVKYVRDELGLANTPFITRRGWPRWMRPIDGLAIAFLLVLAYAWFLYPVLLRGLARALPGRKPASSVSQVSHHERIAILLAAHNEEGVISARVKNLLETIHSDGLTGHAYIFIGSDGSADHTVAAAEEAARGHAHVVVRDFSSRRGKVAVIKDLAGMAIKDGAAVLVLTDANTEFKPGALNALLEPLSDRSVGAVCGKLLLEAGGRSAESVYWNLENELKAAASKLDSCLGANGAIYAVRAEHFWRDVPDNTIVDDFVIGMKVREHGARVVYRSDAVAVEPAPEESAEWKRRVRIGAGDFQALGLCRKCLAPRFGLFAWMFFSQKVLRWVTPHLLVILLGITAYDLLIAPPPNLLFHPPTYVAGAALALGLLAVSGGAAGAPGRLCRHFIMMQAALLVGSLKYFRGNLSGAWDRTPRDRGR